MMQLTAIQAMELSERTGVHVYDIAQAALRYPEIVEIMLKMEQNTKNQF